jgi:hypothetical protein
VKALLLFPVVVVATLTATALAAAQDNGPNDPLADRVKKAIAKGIPALKDARLGDNWETRVNIQPGQKGGYTALAVLALLNCGVKADDPAVRDGLKYLRDNVPNPSTYVRALMTMVFVEANQNQDLQRIQDNVDHFLNKSALRDANGTLLGWTYDRPGDPPGGRPDNSNTQYALLGTFVGHKYLAQKQIAQDSKIWNKFWEDVRTMYVRMQLSDKSDNGGWNYAPDGDAGGLAKGARLTMTTAGLSGLLMAQMELSAAAAKLMKDPVAGCGDYQENPALKRGFEWLYMPPEADGKDRFRLDPGAYAFYNIYGIERLGRLSGQRFIGPHDWYREGCSWLVERQDKNGSWNGTSEHHPLSTSFALLFLSKGRTPVLISKLVHGAAQRQKNDEDWNRRRNDLRHLVEFSSEAVFNKMPMAWQTFDILRGIKAAEGASVEPARLEQQVTADLLQSPILYITGHQSPLNRIRGAEIEVLKKYIENGGFILATACCGADAFDKGFRELCAKLWPESELATLDVDHPIWDMKFPVPPGRFKLKGIQLGCKTVVVYAPENMTGYWELNMRDDEMGRYAFQLGANIVAYATGLEPPRPRLTEVKLAADIKPEDATLKRGYLQVGQLISEVGQEADWKPAPQAMAKLMQKVRTQDGLDVVVKTANVTIDNKDLSDFKFLYMHGRKDFRFTSDRLKQLQFNLKNGGLLLADACCGREAFDKAFRQFVQDLLPRDAFPGVDDKDLPRLVPIPPDDELFSKDVNGVALTAANIQLRVRRGEAARPSVPELEGVKIGGRWVVIYSKYDIGCALENHQSADCVGYSHDSALLLGRAAVLYQLRP